MRLFVVAAALATLIATPALAKPAPLHRAWHHAPVSLSSVDHDLAIKNGFVMGRDPDANVRFELRRDNPYY